MVGLSDEHNLKEEMSRMFSSKRKVGDEAELESKKEVTKW